MPKRSWGEANSTSPTSGAPSDQFQSPPRGGAAPVETPRDTTYRRNNSTAQQVSPAKRTSNSRGPQAKEQRELPGITRKVKACAACRKQKIRCMMDDDEPPCRRCKERGLSCRLNKSLQTLMHEDSRWKSSVSQDISNLYGSLQSVLQSLSLPSISPPHVSVQEPNFFFDHDRDDLYHPGEQEQSFDASPKVSPMTESMTHVPIESLYQITGLRSLKSQDAVEEDDNKANGLSTPDMISRGLVTLEDGERLVHLYLTRLDPYIYGLGRYRDLEAFRRRSSVLTACILTVAALHDTVKPQLYSVCNREFRRLIANSMFERRIDLDYLRALCIGAYWLSDISWTLSGYAIRRASEYHLKLCYYRAIGVIHGPQSRGILPRPEESADGVRVLYLLYICDQHLSTLYGRPATMRDSEDIQGWESFLNSPYATDSDWRIASQVQLLLIMSQVRDLFGPDIGVEMPKAFLAQLTNFNRQLDQWFGKWSARLKPNEHIGNFPSKGVLLHYHFAKFYLCSFVFRGLTNNPVPSHFLETAFMAVSAATSIVESILHDSDLRVSLAGVPHYFHTMIAFACTFLLKVATKHKSQLLVKMEDISDLARRVANLFSNTPAGTLHLVHRMADGLEKLADSLKGNGFPQLKTEHEANGLPL